MTTRILSRDRQRPVGRGRNPWEYRRLRSWVNGARFVAPRNCDGCRAFDNSFATTNQRPAIAEHRDYLVRQYRRGHHDPSLGGDRQAHTLRRLTRRPILQHLLPESWREIARLMVIAERKAPTRNDHITIRATARVMK